MLIAMMHVTRPMSYKHWMVEIRVPFLLLPLVLSFVGGALAYHDGSFNLLDFILFTTVLIFMHIAVNTLNEYYDDRSGIDREQKMRSVFNGGTGMLQAGFVRPEHVLTVAIGSMAAGFLLGMYLVVTISWVLLPVLLLGTLFTAFYTQIFARNMLGEVSAGLGLGLLPVMGAYMVQTGALSAGAIVLGCAAGLLTFNLLFLNEFPDMEADRSGGRRNLVLALGTGKAAWLYAALNVAVYAMLLLFAMDGVIPPLSVLGLLTVPLAYQAASAAFRGPLVREIFIRGQRTNVLVVLVTQVLVVLGICLTPLV